MSRSRSDVLVLGGGVIGLACALGQLRAGRSVTVLERGLAGSGASHGNCGTITPSLLPLPAPGTVAKGLKWMLTADAPLRIKPTLDLELLRWLLAFAGHCNQADFRRTAIVKGELLRVSRNLLAGLIQREALQCEFVESGHLAVYREPRAFAQATADVEIWNVLDIEVEALDGSACRQKEPALNEQIIGGYFHRGDARLRPDRYVSELARVVRAAGGVIEEHTAIEDFRIEHNRLDTVHTARGEFSGEDVVFALGAWSPQIGKKLGLRLPIQPGKGYSITYSRPARAPHVPLVLKERSVCVTSWDSGYRLGSTMEFSGFDEQLNRTRLNALERSAQDYLHEPIGPVTQEEWYGWRPMTSDDLPIIGRASSAGGPENLIVATGHGMLGLSLSAVTANLVAALVDRQSPDIDLEPLSLARFRHR